MIFWVFYSLESSFGPEEAGLILKFVPSCESDMTEWLESSPIALIGVSDLKKVQKMNFAKLQ